MVVECLQCWWNGRSPVSVLFGSRAAGADLSGAQQPDQGGSRSSERRRPESRQEPRNDRLQPAVLRRRVPGAAAELLDDVWLAFHRLVGHADLRLLVGVVGDRISTTRIDAMVPGSQVAQEIRSG